MMAAITMTTGGIVFAAKKRMLKIPAHTTRAVLPVTAPAHAITATMSRFPADGPFDRGTRTNILRGDRAQHPRHT